MALYTWIQYDVQIEYVNNKLEAKESTNIHYQSLGIAGNMMWQMH